MANQDTVLSTWSCDFCCLHYVTLHGRSGSELCIYIFLTKKTATSDGLGDHFCIKCRTPKLLYLLCNVLFWYWRLLVSIICSHCKSWIWFLFGFCLAWVLLLVRGSLCFVFVTFTACKLLRCVVRLEITSFSSSSTLRLFPVSLTDRDDLREVCDWKIKILILFRWDFFLFFLFFFLYIYIFV